MKSPDTHAPLQIYRIRIPGAVPGILYLLLCLWVWNRERLNDLNRKTIQHLGSSLQPQRPDEPRPHYIWSISTRHKRVPPRCKQTECCQVSFQVSKSQIRNLIWSTLFLLYRVMHLNYQSLLFIYLFIFTLVVRKINLQCLLASTQ